MGLTKEDIVGKIWNRQSNMNRGDVRKVVNQVFEEVENGLIDGQQVRISGFGIFATSVHKSLKYRDPRTGKALDRPVARITFKGSKSLKDGVKATHVRD